MLAELDDERGLRALEDEANRANVSFYPIDPRGLAVFDTPIARQDTLGPPPPIVRPEVDKAAMTRRADSLRRIAEAVQALHTTSR